MLKTSLGFEWTHQTGDKYHVTGVTVYGKRFKIVTENPHYALGINLYRGSMWLVRNGKRRLVRQVSN